MIELRNNAILTTPLTVTAAATKVPFDTVVYNTNEEILGFDSTNSNITMLIPGAFDTTCAVQFTNTGSASATVTLTAYANGVAIPGAFVSETVGAAATSSLVLPWAACAASATSGTANISWYISGAAGTVGNAFAKASRFA